MSSTFRMSIRERWAAREVTVEHWHVQAGGTFKYKDPIVDIRVDGVSRVLTYDARDGSDPEGGVYWHFVDGGHEVGPWGYLLEYTDWPASRPGPVVSSRRPARIKYKRRDHYPRVFLSYRKDDSDAYAGRLHETLVRALGPDDVFMDQFSIRPGEQFPWTIQQAVWHAPIMVCVIGPKWGSLQDSSGTRRLDREWDYVRREIAAALDTGTTIIPIVLSGGELPALTGLPDDMRPLGDLQALALSQRHWDAETSQVIDAIRAELNE